MNTEAARDSDRPMKAIFALRRFVYPPVERCEICRASLPGEHGHVLELGPSQLRCACPACMHRYGSTDSGFLAVTPRREKLADFVLPDAAWSAFQIPIDLAFLVRKAGTLTALYPGPAGIVQSEPAPEAWAQLAERNPVLGELTNEVEALVVNRVHGRRDAYRLSIDHCFALAGMMRREWHGLSGGPKVWNMIESYFDDSGAAGHA